MWCHRSIRVPLYGNYGARNFWINNRLSTVVAGLVCEMKAICEKKSKKLQSNLYLPQFWQMPSLFTMNCLKRGTRNLSERRKRNVCTWIFPSLDWSDIVKCKINYHYCCNCRRRRTSIRALFSLLKEKRTKFAHLIFKWACNAFYTSIGVNSNMKQCSNVQTYGM